MKLFVLIVVCCIAGVYSQPLCALANNPQQLAILQDVPVLYYQLNDFEHPAVRNYGPLATALDGTFQGTPTLNVAGVHPEPNLRDAAVAFNRASPGQGITRAAHPALQSTSFSVEAWAFPDGVAGSQTIYNNLNTNTGYALFFQGNLWVCRIGTGAGTVDVTASEYQNEADLWTHAVCIYDSTTSTATLYVDGRVQNTVNTAYSPSTGGVTIATGALGDFVGILDEIAVFDFPLTHEDVRDHWGYVFVYASLTENFRPFAYYRMEEPLLETVLENDGIGGPALNLNSLGIPTSGFPTGLFAALPGQNIANSNRGLAGTPLNIAGTYGTTGNQPFFQSPSFTFVGWIDPINGGAFASNLVDTGNILSPVTQGFRFSYSLLPALTFTVQIGTGGAATILSSNNAPLGFNHVAVTYNATSRELKYFLNGAVAAQTTTTYLPNTIPGSRTFIGGDGTVLGGFTGTLDEIAFMDYVLTEQEVASLVGGGVETCNDASFITCPANEVCVSYGPRCAVCVGITSQIINNVDVGTPYTIDRNRVYDWDVVHTNLVPAQDVLSYAVPGQANTLGSRYFVDEYTPDLPIDLLTVPGGVNNLRVAAFLKRAPGQWHEFAVQLNLSNDFDGDGILDAVDRDIDNDGILNTDEPGDTDGDGFPDQMDLDSDNDGIPDIIEIGGQDTNGDGFVDNFTDGNGDGFHDPFETIPLLQVDTDNDGHFDGVDLDSDNDGIPDIVETGLGFLDTNYDGLIDTILDPNRDGMHDTVSVTSPVRDTDVDGVPDFLDLDSDNDGVPDVVETGIANTIQLPGRLIGITDANSDGFDDNLVGRINPDTDNDGFPDYLDLDSDNDGMSDTIEVNLGAFDGDNNGVLVSFTDANGDGWDDTVSAATTPVPNFDSDAFEDFRDIDSDNDGIIDSAENLLFNIPTTDANGNGFYDAAEGSTVFNHDGDSLPNYLDLDSDWDDIPDVIEAGGNDANGDGFIDGFVDVGPADGLHDGLPLGGLFQDTDGDGAPDHLDLDSDNDTIFDVVEGVSIDGDRNGIADVLGAATAFDGNYPDTDSDGQEDFRDLDSDNDAIGDISEAQMFVQSLVDSDVDGVADLPDTDGDGIPNVVDDSASWGTLSGYPIPLDSDSDGNPDHLEIDSNNDSITDLFVAFGTAGSVFDMNGDGVVDDPTDTDRDGIADVVDTKATFGGLSATKDTDRDTIPDIFDGDADNDGILNVDEPAGDNDGDGIPNYLDSDSDNDGIPDTIESGQTDSNYDGYVDGFVDLDSDGVHDPLQINPIVPVDLDSDTVPDFVDIDSDNDGLPDVQETSFTGAPINLGQITILPGDDTNVNGWSDLAEVRRTGRDRDSDARQDHLDRDSDNDGISDAHELGHPDATNDGVVDGFVDTNSNGWHDALEFNFVPRNTDGDSVPDYWDLDSDNDGISDVQESGASDFGGDFLTDFFIDVNRDGISDRAINRAIPDTDSDGVHDYRDLDSDNDSLSDLFESFVFANLAPVDSNDNGVLDNIDTDGDGIVDAIDQTTNRGNSNQFVSSNNWRRVDSDGDGTPDMIEFRNDIDFTVVDPDGNGIVVGVDVDADGIVDIIDDNTSAFGFLRAPVFILPSPSATSVPSVTRSPVAPSSSRSPIPSASFVPSVVPSSPPSSPPSIPVPSPGASSSSQASASSAASSTASSAASSAASRSAAPSTSSAPTASRTSTHTREPVPIPVSSAVPSPIVVDSLNPNSVEIVVELACRNGLSCTQEEVSEFIITIGVLINDPDAVTIVSLDGTVLTFVVCDNSFILELVAELSTSTPQPRFAIFSTADVLSVVYDVPCVDYYYFIESVSAQTVLAASLLGAFTMAMLI